MREIVLILLVALVAAWVAVPPGEPTPSLIRGGGVSLPDLDRVTGESRNPMAWNPLYNWVTAQLWRAVYALEGIGI